MLYIFITVNKSHEKINNVSVSQYLFLSELSVVFFLFKMGHE